jgi:23S rRNA-/tRNA-specific pseudouridylate synthase
MVVHPAPGSPNGTFVNALLHHLGENATNLIPATEDALDILSSEYLDGDSDDQYLIDNSDTMGDNSNAMKDLPETPEAAKASPVQLRPGVVHRLDKGTTGILLAGKNPFAVGKLSSLFEKRLVEKTYLAICVGHPGTTTIVESIGRSDKNRQTMTVYDDGRGKLAISHVRTIAFDGKLSACLVRIETGRTHQIRVHLQHRRTPVLGDETYGKADWNKKYHRGDKIDRPLLHAYETKFVNPFTKEELSLRAPLPEDMRNLLKKVSFNLKDQVLDMDSGMLTCDTFVEGDDYVGEREKKGYVPMDRLQMEEDHWTSYDLPETLEELEE